MRTITHRWLRNAAGGAVLGLMASLGWAQGPEAIGVLTGVQGTVTAEHRGSPTPMRLAVRHALRATDTVDTGAHSKAKALFHDDTVLALGQRTRITIAEYLHAPDQGIRRMVVHLERGTIRALIGRAFREPGSTFVIRTGAANVIADAAYCVVWRHEQETGVVNIGSAGAVSFAAGGGTVILEPGFYSIAQASKPPTPARPADAKAPPTVRQVIAETEVAEQLGSTPGELAEQEIEEELLACPPGSPPGGICPRQPPPAALPPFTPPAVISGAIRR